MLLHSENLSGDWEEFIFILGLWAIPRRLLCYMYLKSGVILFCELACTRLHSGSEIYSGRKLSMNSNCQELLLCVCSIQKSFIKRNAL